MPKPIKVCFVSLYAYHFFHPETTTRFGGAELQLYTLASELSKDERFDAHFVVGNFGQPNREVCQGVTLYKFFKPKIKFSPLSALHGFIKLWLILRQINADIYIQRAAGFETGVAALFCKLNKKKFIYMVASNDDLKNEKPKWMPAGLLGDVRWALFKIGIRIAPVLIAQHEEQVKEIKNKLKKEARLRSSAHLIPTDPINLDEKNNILWVGRGEDWKQPDIFLDLAKELPEYKFVMVCQPANFPAYFTQIQSRVNELQNIAWFSYIPFSDIDSYFKKAKIFINTSKTEGFPNTFVQAMKWRTPIVSLNVDPDALLERNHIGFNANNNFQNLVTQVKRLLADKNLWQEMAENGYRYAQKHHDIKKIIEQDKKLIIQLVQNGAKSL